MIVAAACAVTWGIAGTACGGEDARVASDTPEKALTMEEIVLRGAVPSRQSCPVMPACTLRPASMQTGAS